jgi:hypothetical protein
LESKRQPPEFLLVKLPLLALPSVEPPPRVLQLEELPLEVLLQEELPQAVLPPLVPLLRVLQLHQRQRRQIATVQEHKQT